MVAAMTMKHFKTEHMTLRLEPELREAIQNAPAHGFDLHRREPGAD
jgi:hypothetical protein